MINDEADEVMKQLFDSLIRSYQSNLETMKGNDLLFDYVHLLYYECHKINPNCDRLYIDSPDWIHEEIEKVLERIKKIKPFINKYNW